MTHTIYFDMDDTLIQTQEVYMNAKTKNIELLHSLFESTFTKDEIAMSFARIDRQNIDAYGFSMERFPMSWIDTYHHLINVSSGTHSTSIENLIRKNAEAVFKTNIPLYDDAIESLEYACSLGFEVNLLTLGEEKVQQKRIDDARIRDHFDNIHIVSEKSYASYKKILKGKKPENCTMIGNSLRSDIHPSLQHKMKAIHILRSKRWHYDDIAFDKTNPDYRAIHSLLEIKHHLHK